MATTVSAVIRRNSTILLVRHRRGRLWFLPGGVVEPGEHLHDALRREVLEETGLTVAAPTQLAWASHMVVRPSSEEVTSGQSFVFDVGDPGGDPIAGDPDGDIDEVAFHEPDRALDLIGQISWHRIRRPALAYLEGSARPGTVWLWECETDQPDGLIATIPGLDSEAPRAARTRD